MYSSILRYKQAILFKSAKSTVFCRLLRKCQLLMRTRMALMCIPGYLMRAFLMTLYISHPPPLALMLTEHLSKFIFIDA